MFSSIDVVLIVILFSCFSFLLGFLFGNSEEPDPFPTVKAKGNNKPHICCGNQIESD